MGPVRGAFSLAELLVVIAIVALLASLLMPTIGMAREAAGKTSCAARLRQVGMAVQAYADEHEGLMAPPMVAADPPAEWDWPYGTLYIHGPLLGTYDERIAAYRGGYLHLGNYFGPATPGGRDSMFHCPRDPRRSGVYNISYGLNLRLTPVVNTGPSGEDAWRYNIRRLGQFSRLSDRVYAIDAGIERWDPGGGATPSLPMIRTATLLAGIGNWSAGTAEAYYDWTNWHRQGANLLFLDGHVRFAGNPAAESAAGTALFVP